MIARLRTRVRKLSSTDRRVKQGELCFKATDQSAMVLKTSVYLCEFATTYIRCWSRCILAQVLYQRAVRRRTYDKAITRKIARKSFKTHSTLVQVRVVVSAYSWLYSSAALDIAFRRRPFLQCFVTVGWVKPVPDMTYNVFGGTLNLAEPPSTQCRAI